MELKTLKDLKDIDFAADNNNIIYGFSEVIKQEAIEWIKELRENYKQELELSKMKYNGGKNSIFLKIPYISTIMFDDETLEFKTKSKSYKDAIRLLVNWIKYLNIKHVVWLV